MTHPKLRLTRLLQGESLGPEWAGAGSWVHGRWGTKGPARPWV